MIQLFYGIAAMNALFSSMAWCAAKPNRWSILALLTFAVIWPFVPLTGIWKATSFLRWTARRNPSVEHGDITEKP